MYLSATNETLQVVLGSTVTTNQLEWHCSYQDITSAGMTLPQSSSQGLTNNTTDVDMVAAPAASTTRQVIIVNIYNDDTVSQTVTVKKDVGGTDTILWKGLLQAGSTLYWSREDGWSVITGTTTADVTFDVFTSNGTYTKPAGLKAAFVVCIGAGGGGGSGARNAAGTNRFGGGGGQGGVAVWTYFPASALTSTVSVTVGTGGPGAPGAAADNTNGTTGTAGGQTIFGASLIVAPGGNAGTGGTTAAGGSGGSGALGSLSYIPYGPYSMNGNGGSGGTTNTASSAGTAGMNLNGATPGGAGGSGISSGNVSATSAGAGGGILQNGISIAGPNAGATPNGVNNKSNFLHFSPTLTSGTGIGTGGAGGYPAFKDGGSGGYCAGGGGGSGVLNGTVSGAGGTGGGGLCIVMNIF